MRHVCTFLMLCLSFCGLLTGCATARAEAPAPGDTELVLVPAPRSIVRVGTETTEFPLNLRSEAGFKCGETPFIPREFDAVKAQLNSGTLTRCKGYIDIAKKEMPAQGYRIEFKPGELEIEAADPQGLFYAFMTLRQIARQCRETGEVPCLRIEDAPDFPNRGFMIDVARCKVPEMSSLYAFVDKMAELKCNQLQMYTEHTFAYRNHHTVWEDASPMTPAQIHALDQYCRDRFITLVPNQNSFGHMNRWLSLPAYAALAETPNGSDLCPIDPGSIALLQDMYDDMLPNFSAPYANVGCDETWTLGKGRSKEACDARGVGRVYFEFLMKIRDICQKHEKTMQFWGDIIMNHPELIPEIPDGVIAMEWGYAAGHPFAEHGKKFAESGVPFYVVPGTSSWNTWLGNTNNAIANLRNAAENGLANGAIGYLVTDWGDGGHWQPLPVSYVPFAYGAAVSWACAANKDLDVTRAVDAHWFEDRAAVMSRLAFDLGNAHAKSGLQPGNSSVYYYLMAHNVDGEVDPALTADNLRATIAEIDRAMADLPRADMVCPEAALIKREFELAARFTRFACRLGIARIDAGRVGTSKVPAELRHALAEELAPLIPEFRSVWLERNRSGGLKESAGQFENLLAMLRQ